MSNIIQFRPAQHGKAAPEGCEASSESAPAALRASARDALNLVVGQLESAVRRAHTIEQRIRDPRTRQEFADQIEFTRRLLDLAYLKIAQL